MKMRIYSLIIGMAIISGSLALVAQEKRASSRARIGAGVDGAAITLDYARPKIQEAEPGETRKRWGGVAPYGQAWPVGAGESALLISDKDLVMGKTTIPAGTNSLYAWLGEDGTAKLVISKQVGQGSTQYDPAQDLARVDMQKETLNRKVDPFTMAIVMDPSGGGTLKMMFENTQYSARFYVRR
jgi:hypothetical protein